MCNHGVQDNIVGLVSCLTEACFVASPASNSAMMGCLGTSIHSKDFLDAQLFPALLLPLTGLRC